ncbi:hypothetical protein P4O66_006740, partial [Electrophorus voltai]
RTRAPLSTRLHTAAEPMEACCSPCTTEEVQSSRAKWRLLPVFSLVAEGLKRLAAKPVRIIGIITALENTGGINLITGQGGSAVKVLAQDCSAALVKSERPEIMGRREAECQQVQHFPIAGVICLTAEPEKLSATVTAARIKRPMLTAFQYLAAASKAEPRYKGLLFTCVFKVTKEEYIRVTEQRKSFCDQTPETCQPGMPLHLPPARGQSFSLLPPTSFRLPPRPPLHMEMLRFSQSSLCLSLGRERDEQSRDIKDLCTEGGLTVK